MDIRKWAEDTPAVMAMGGTPVSVGPADIKGPLMCLTSDRVGGQSQHSGVINDLDGMDKRFNELVEIDEEERFVRSMLTKVFHAKLRAWTLFLDCPYRAFGPPTKKHRYVPHRFQQTKNVSRNASYQCRSVGLADRPT